LLRLTFITSVVVGCDKYKHRVVCMWMFQMDDSSTCDKIDFKLSIPCSAFLVAVPCSRWEWRCVLSELLNVFTLFVACGRRESPSWDTLVYMVGICGELANFLIMQYAMHAFKYA